MIALELSGELAIGFDSSGERFFEQDAMSGLNHEAGVSVMILSGGYNDGRFAHSGASELFDGRENRDIRANILSDTMGAFSIEISKRGELAGFCFTSEFLDVKSVDCAHAAKTGHGNFQAFRHESQMSKAQCTPRT